VVVVCSPAAADDPDAGERLRQPNVPEGYRIVEGDILMRESEIGQPNPGRFSTFQPNKRWPNGIVPFVLDTSVTNWPSRQATAMSAMAMVAAGRYGSDIQFVPRTNEGDYIEYVNDKFSNFSPVGRQGGRQDIHISNWGNVITVCHETMHSLGFWHEQSRSDRDTYVTIHTENVCDTCCNHGGCAFNFDKESGSSNYGPYDFDSAMHYGKCSFIRPTIFCTQGNYTIVVNAPWATVWQDSIGQRTHLSRMDRVTLSFLYPQSNWRFADANGGFNGTGDFLDPYPTFTDGVLGTPSGGTLYVQPGNYPLFGGMNSLSTPMRIEAPLGSVQLTVGPSLASVGSRK
jgi:hypothetical protein